MPSDRSSRRGKPAAPRLQDTVRLSAEGLAKVLGDLESRVMETVWSFGAPVTARSVADRVLEEHPVVPLTVITVLNKLVAKRLLRRRARKGLLHYEAVMSEAEFRAHVSRRVVDGILSFGSEAVAASFVDALAEQDPELLAELGRLVRRRLREQRADAPDGKR